MEARSTINRWHIANGHAMIWKSNEAKKSQSNVNEWIKPEIKTYWCYHTMHQATFVVILPFEAKGEGIGNTGIKLLSYVLVNNICDFVRYMTKLF